MAVDLSIEERYIQHQRGLFIPKHVPVAYVPTVMSAAAAPRVPCQVRAPERPDQSLHVVVQSLQKQVNELQTLVRSLQHQVPPSEVPTEPVAPKPTVARTPSEEELLRLHRERRAHPESKPREELRKAPAAAPEAPAAVSLRPSGQRELSEPRRQVKRSWIQGLSKGPSRWQILQQRLCLKEDKKNEERQSSRRPSTSLDAKVNEEVKNQSLEELCKFISTDLEHRYGCLEVAAAFAALSMQMCSEQEIDTFLASVEDGERGLRVAPLTAASALPAIAFGAQGFEDALIDVLQVRVSRRNARRLFRQLAAQPCSQRAAIGSVGTTAQLTQLTQLGKPSGDGSSHESHESPAISPPRQEQTAQTAQSARSQPEKGLNRSQSETRTRPKTTRVEVGVTKRPSLGVHLQEQMRQHWQGGLREKREEKSNKAASRPQKIRETREKSESPDTSKLSSRRSSLKTPPPVQPSNSTGALPPAVNRRSYEVWRRDVSLKSLLAFEAEVKARQESSTTSSEDGAEANRELPGSSRSSKLPSSDSPPSSLRLRRSSEEERLEALPARLAEAMEGFQKQAERRGT